MGKLGNRIGERGYLLITVIVLGLAISIVGVTALGVVTQNSSTLNNQYYSELAREAARAGIAAAARCVQANQMDWDSGGNPKLQPQTDCHGATVSGRPTTVMDDGTIQSTYVVNGLENPYGNTTRIVTATGTAVFKNPIGGTIVLATKTVRTIGQLTGFGGTTVSGVSTGYSHSCGIASSQAYCWGDNRYGQLGNGTTANSIVPVGVSTTGIMSGKAVANITNSTYHSCAVASGNAYCWGYNGSGQLGNSTNTNSNVPVAVSTSGVLNGKTVTSISAGPQHTCVVASGQAYCWGANNYGQLGNGTNTDSNVPVAVSTSGVLSGKTVTSISAGQQQTCAVASGLAYCWGDNGYGKLGINNNWVFSSNVPVAVYTAGVLNGKTVTAVTTGNTHSCAIASGAAYCWGDDTNGMLGDGTTNNSLTPVAVSTSGVLNGKTVTNISSGAQQTCAIADGKAYCWGWNTSGLGDSGSTIGSTVPLAVSTSVMSGTVTDISTGQWYACAVASGNAYCWGSSNGGGSLGDGSGASFPQPVSVHIAGTFSGKTVSMIDTSYTQTCGIANSQAYCWGYNGWGQLGNNSTTDSYVPVAVSTSGVLNGKTVDDVATGTNHSCAVASGNAYCWGYNGSGQLGTGNTTNALVPVAVSTSGVLSGKTVTKISADSSHTCATASGQAYCWGDNNNGYLGNGTTTGSNAAVAVSTSGVLNGKTVTDIETGYSHTCAIANGKAYCWGDNSYGQLGNGNTTSSNVPVAVSTSGVLNGKTVTAVSAGNQVTCVVADGKAYCWGNNGNNQIGDGTSNNANAPVAVDTSGVLNGKTVTAISVGSQNTCAVADGKAYCWGWDVNTLGDGSSSHAPSPVAVSTSGVMGGKTVTAISAGQWYACAVADAKGYCWGSNNLHGALGNATTDSTSVPVGIDSSGANYTLYAFDNQVFF